MINDTILKAAKKIIDDERKFNPKASLADYYKLIFQAVFGPAHILKDKNEAYKVLQREISILDASNKMKIQDLSMINDFIRVDLSLLKKHNIGIDDFFEIVLKSAELPSKIDKEEWHNIWKNVETYLSDFNLKNFDKEKEIIGPKAEDTYTFHHSEIYKTTYKPHYRVVSKELWQNLLKRD